MAEKKYYWLKLQNDFFGSKRIKKLRKLGADFVIIYLKMQLLALKTNGVLEYTGIEDSFADELALDIDEDTDKVQLTISFLQASGLLEARENNEFFLPYVEKNTGSETSVAERVRKHREKKYLEENRYNVTLMSHDGNTDVTNCNTEKEKEKEKEIEIEIDTSTTTIATDKGKYGDFNNVYLSLEEFKALREMFGAKNLLHYINKMSFYQHQTGNEYKNHYEALIYWMREDGVYDEG